MVICKRRTENQIFKKQLAWDLSGSGDPLREEKRREEMNEYGKEQNNALYAETTG
jgi:hypothetical protein